MNKKLRVGVIGCGRISIRHFLSTKNSEFAELIACADIKENRAEKCAREYNIKSFIDYKEMIDNCNLDVVHICTPHYLHTEIAKYAMEHGVNVLSEKPMSIDFESATNIVDLSKKLGLKYGVIFQTRYNKPIQEVKKIIQSNKLGKIISVSSKLTWCRNKEYYDESDWKGTWDKEGGGVVIDQAIHSIDLVNWMIDSDYDYLDAKISNIAHKYIKVEDTAEGIVHYKNGVDYSFFCTNTYNVNAPIEIKIILEKGKIYFSYNDALVEYNDGTKEYYNIDKKEYDIEKTTDYWGNSHVKQINQFYKACLGLEPLEISGEEALKTHKIIFDIYKKGKEKATL